MERGVVFHIVTNRLISARAHWAKRITWYKIAGRVSAIIIQQIIIIIQQIRAMPIYDAIYDAKTIILLNLAEYRLILTDSAYGLVG